MAPNESVKATERIHDRALDNKKQIDGLEKRKNTLVSGYYSQGDISWRIPEYMGNTGSSIES